MAISDADFKKLQKTVETLQKQVDKAEKDDPSDKVQDLIKRMDQIQKDQKSRDTMQDRGNKDVSDNFKQLNQERHENEKTMDDIEKRLTALEKKR